MFLRPTDKSEVLKIISVLYKKYSSGLDLIPITLLKSCAFNLNEPLTTIMNCSLSTGIFPERLKQATVIPIHKKKEKYLVENYRPFSLVSIFGKNFGKIMHTRLYSFVKKHLTELTTIFISKNWVIIVLGVNVCLGFKVICQVEVSLFLSTMPNLSVKT